MVEIGRINTLKVVKKVDFGLYLDGGEAGEILLPNRYIPTNWKVGESLDVFIYRDSEDRMIATSERPYAMVGEFACLQVISVSRVGAFLDWGLPKDLLLPFSEQIHEVEEGKRYVVSIYLDEQSDRITASAKLDDFLYDESDNDFEVGEAVEIFIANKTALGYKAIVNHSHWGLLHHHEVIAPLKRGTTLSGFIKNIRDDGKLNLALYIKGRDKTDDAVATIMQTLKQHAGFLPVTDKSSPEEIREHFNLSKGMYKKAVGSLYKRKHIMIDSNGITLLKKR